MSTQNSTGVRHPASPATDVTIRNAVQSSIQAGDVLKGSVKWTATPPAGARSVEFWFDGVRLATDVAPPYAYTLGTRRYANGAHVLGVAWTDSGGTRHPAVALAVTISN